MTGQPQTDEQGILYRTVIESLALQYRLAIDNLDRITGMKTEKIYFLGGAVQDNLFCQFIANASGREIVTGPVEATAVGNAMIQLLALNEMREMTNAQVVRRSFNVQSYKPAEQEAWNRALRLYCEILRKV